MPSIVPEDVKEMAAKKKESPAESKGGQAQNGKKEAQSESSAKQLTSQTAAGQNGNSADKQPKTADDVPVFKVQIIASDKAVKANSPQFKGIQQTELYKESGLYKYTTGSSTDYNEIYRLRKSILGKFPSAFIIAFKNGQKMDVRVAIREFKENKK